MEKVLAWIKRHWLVFTLILFFIPLLIIHILFKICPGDNRLMADWSSGDLLGYIAGFYSFIGTALLGVVTVEQSYKAQKINERLSQENNYLQKVATQKLIPVVRVKVIDVKKAESARHSTEGLEGTAVVGEHISPESRRTFIDVVLPHTVKEGLQVKTVILSLENISEGAIRQISVERVEFSGFRLCGEDIPRISCQGHEKYKCISDLMLPLEPLEIEIHVYYSDKRYTRFWEFSGTQSVGNFDICLFLKNTSLSEIVCHEKIYINKEDGCKEKIIYRTFEEENNHKS